MEVILDQAVYYHEGAFPPSEIDYPRIVDALVDAGSALARYDQELSLLHNRELFLAPLISQEAVLSSRMEGTISTIDEILQYDSAEDGGGASTKETRSDIIETVLYRRTLHYAEQEIRDGKTYGNQLIRSMHQMLLSMGRGAAKTPGQYKTEQNYIGNERTKKVSYVPISPEKLPEGLERLFCYLAESKHPELVKTAFAHIEFEALHPFKDGNGRIGRMLITLMLWSYGAISSPHFYVSRYLEEHKDDYITGMRTVSSHNDWTGWLLFFFKAVKEQAEYNLDITQQIRALYDDMKVIFNDVSGSKHASVMLDAVFTTPVFRTHQLGEKTGIPSASVSRIVKDLLEDDRNLLKVVRQPAGRRAAIYSFEPLLELIRV